MKYYFYFIIIMVSALTALASAQETPVNYGPEWEDIKQSYEKITDSYRENRFKLLKNNALSKADKTRQIQLEHDKFMNKSRKLAARRNEIIKIAAKRSGLTYTLGSDPAKGRGMAGDIDLGGTPSQANKFIRELKTLGIADAFDEAGSITRKPGYVSLNIPMDVTVNYKGSLGQVGSSAYENQIAVDARSKETYLSVAMEKNQPGRKAVTTLDHIRKARQGLKTPADKILNSPEALQLACKGTFKALNEIKINDSELKTILKKSRLNMTPDQFLDNLDRIRKGSALAPELANLNDKNIKAMYNAMDETTRVCQNKALQSFQNDITIARGTQGTLRRSNDPGLRSQLPKTRAQIIDANIRMRENLNALIEMDTGNSGHLKNKADIKVQKNKMKLWMNTIEQGVPKTPASPVIFGKTKQLRLPGMDTINDAISRRIKGYQAFRNNARVNSVTGKGMQFAGGAMAVGAFYSSAKASGDSDFWAATKAFTAGIASTTRFGSMVIDAADIQYTFTAKADNYKKDQEMRYALMGMDTEDQKAKDLINTRVLIRKGAYGVVKATGVSSIFMTHPALMITGAAMEAGLSVYEAYEEAALWELYADKIEKANQATDSTNILQGVNFATRVAKNMTSHAQWLNKVVQTYHELVKEKDGFTDMGKKFANNNSGFHTYLKSLSTTLETIEKPDTPATIDESGAKNVLTTLNQVEGQARQCLSQVSRAAGLAQNPAGIDSALAILGAMTGEYQALGMQLEISRPLVMQLTAENKIAPMKSPVSSLKAYHKQLTELKSRLEPRSKAVLSLMGDFKSINRQIEKLYLRKNEYLGTKGSQGRIVRYKDYLAGQPGPEAAQALTKINNALAMIRAVEVPSWKPVYLNELQRYNTQLNKFLNQVQSSLSLVNTLYPEPIESLYKNMKPKTLALSPKIAQQWQKSGTAMANLYSALSSLRAMLGQPMEEEKMIATKEEDVQYSEWDHAELKKELDRLKALKNELKKRSEAQIADLTNAYHSDTDALWKAYLSAFKKPRLMACKNCGTSTLHSMDHSESPPSVWCNVCGRILSFKTWAGKGRSVADIHKQGQGKKSAIKDQLATNLRAVDMAIQQVNEAMSGE